MRIIKNLMFVGYILVCSFFIQNSFIGKAISLENYEENVTKEISNYKSWKKIQPRAVVASGLSFNGQSARIWNVTIDDNVIVDGIENKSNSMETKVNKEPVPKPVDSLPSKINKQTVNHGVDYLKEFVIDNIYVNEVGKEIVDKLDTRSFPIGTIIVREKLINNQPPETLVVMVKRERGFNEKNGDWEFLTLDGTALKIIGKEKEGECLNCHIKASKTDYVFYQWNKLIKRITNVAADSWSRLANAHRFHSPLNLAFDADIESK